MYRLSDRILCYMYLREIGACNRAQMVFDEHIRPFYDDTSFACHPFDEIITRVVDCLSYHIQDDHMNNAVLDVILLLAEEYSWMSAHTDFWRRWEQARNNWSPARFEPNPDDDLPF